MIEHLRGRDRKLEPLGWTGQDAEWIALVCLHSGVFTRAQFCHYFDTAGRVRAFRFVQTLVERRQAIESEWPLVNGGRENVPDIEQAGCHAAAFVAGFCAGTSGYELAPRRAGEGRVF